MLSMLLTNKGLIVCALLLVIISGQYVYLRHLSAKNDVLSAEKVTLQVQLTESQANVIQLQNDIKTQNSAIDQFKKDAEIRLAKNAEEVKTAQTIAKNYKAQADEVLRKVTPQDMSVCDAANFIINEEIRNVRR